VTHTRSDRGFIYTIFGLGASHMGFRSGFEQKVRPTRAPPPIYKDHCLWHGLYPADVGLRLVSPRRYEGAERADCHFSSNSEESAVGGGPNLNGQPEATL
jgi:hypothetical protein